MPNGHGGAREGAGRKRNERNVVPVLAEVVQSLTATLVGMAIGQSNVSLELDSKNSVKPAVSVYNNDVGAAGKSCEAEFDRLMDKYHKKPPSTAPAALDEFTESDLKLLGLQRIAQPKSTPPEAAHG